MAWTSRWLSNTVRARVRELAGPDETIDRLLDWLRTVVLEPDVLLLDIPRFRGHFVFLMPLLPGARPVRVNDAEPARIRFVLRQRPGRLDPDLRGFRRVFLLSDVELLERDAPHGHLCPLRLGISTEEATLLLAHARRLVVQATSEPGAVPNAAPKDWPARFRQRCGVGLAIWTRGELRGSVVNSPAPLSRGLAVAAGWAAKDKRFKPLSPEELPHSRLQLSLVHAPCVPIPKAHIDSRAPYADKAFFVREGTRAGVYVPEIFNLRRLRSMRALSHSLAVEKAGLRSFSSRTVLEVCQTHEFIESASQDKAIALHGPVAVTRSDEPLQARARRAGIEACRWLAAIQRADGSLPQRVVPQTGRLEGDDRARAAMTAHAAAVFGQATGCAQAIEIARGVWSWLDQSQPQGEPAAVLLAAAYQGKLALALGHDDGAIKALGQVRVLLPRAAFEPLTFSHVASLMRAASKVAPLGRDDYSPICDRLVTAFQRDREQPEPISLARWAELVVAFPPGSDASRQVAQWLAGQQLESGAFPNTTASDFAYTRGTGKIFEVIAASPHVQPGAVERCLEWLLGLQYDAESMFFVPEQHRSLVQGGFRHDAFDADAWIDSAGHVLLGLARWEQA